MAGFKVTVTRHALARQLFPQILGYVSVSQLL